jgi:hypothetical protein
VRKTAQEKGMNRQLPVWRGQGEGFGTFTRLLSRIFSRRFLGGEIQLLGAVALFFTNFCNLFGFLPYVQVECRFRVRQSARLQHYGPPTASGTDYAEPEHDGLNSRRIKLKD